ncbi:alpha-amylase family protein [Kocuria sp. M4R2S49]|uniref:alpha-amylase family protein n=1 Tax=Kocuria rhizosphaericola TaxID=3376284 RepID=UPI00379573DF
MPNTSTPGIPGLSPENQARVITACVRQKVQEGRPADLPGTGWADFDRRFDEHFPRLTLLFAEIYGHREDFLEQLSELGLQMARSWAERPEDLKALDARREQDPAWFGARQMLGGVCYVDRYAGNLQGIREQIPYFRELGLTYLHLMPLFEAPKGNSDGGYAVSSYRRVNPALGTTEELAELSRELRRNGISLVLDFVFNHTSDEHEWARRAAAGEQEYEDYYWIFPDRTVPEQFELTTREIFPDDHPGSFTRVRATEEDPRWVWSTFYSFQWDLNYTNPAVFRAMAAELLFLAAQGVEVLRMDAVAFIWKQLGTTCESLPQAHVLLRAYNALCRIAAPAVLFKSEAIVHPDEVARYIEPGQCQLSYNPLQMALTWEAMATREPKLLAQALEERHALPPGTAWVDYVRGHDDIGWTFSDEDAARLGVDGHDHRRFLNAFYTGRHPGSFADGVPFQENPRTGDCRVCGTTASLLGLAGDPGPAVDRILLAHSVTMSTGGVPLLYLGDEVGQLNDPSWNEDPDHAGDARWVHRPPRPVQDYERRHELFSVQGRIFGGIRRMVELRRNAPEFDGNTLVPFDARNPHVLGYQRPGVNTLVLCLANFSDWSQFVTGETLSGFLPQAVELHGSTELDLRHGLLIDAHGFLWIRVVPKR